MNDRAKELPDLGQLQQWLNETPMTRFMGIRADSWDRDGGILTCSMSMRLEFCNRENGALHGGAVASLIDTVACFAVLAKGIENCTTAGLHVDYVRPAINTELRCLGRIRRLGRTLALVDGEVLDDTARLVAVGRANIAIISP